VVRYIANKKEALSLTKRKYWKKNKL